jgi:hypothetical protein
MAKRGWHRAFRLMQRFGVNVLPAHFYSCVPDLHDLAQRDDWRKPRSMHGIACRSIEDQVALLGEWVLPQRDLLSDGRLYHDAIAGGGGDSGYGEIEAMVLASFVATTKPRRIIQVGCGVSTAVIRAAAVKAGHAIEIVCVEPYPSGWLREAASRDEIRLAATPAQRVDTAVLCDLGEGDLLFIDSTHAVKPGSEVNYLIHEVLPRLPAGAWVHFHDIYFPYDYPRDALEGDLLFPQESTLLYAFLTGNERFRVELSLSMVHYAAPEALKRLIPAYDPASQTDGLADGRGGHFPSAAWLQLSGS